MDFNETWHGQITHEENYYVYLKTSKNLTTFDPCQFFENSQ